jgi:hypothetical protein
MDWRDVRTRVSYQIKKKRKKERGRPKKEEKLHTRNYALISFSIDMQD